MANMVKHWDTFITRQQFEILQSGRGQSKYLNLYPHSQYALKGKSKCRRSCFAARAPSPAFTVGISHVRIPVAYWYWQVEEGEPFPQPNLDDQDPNRYRIWYTWNLTFPLTLTWLVLTISSSSITQITQILSGSRSGAAPPKLRLIENNRQYSRQIRGKEGGEWK